MKKTYTIMTTDSIELTINGTPYEFANFAIDFGEKQRAANPDAPRYYISNVPRISIAPNPSPFYRSIATTEIDYAALQNSSRLIIECVQGGGVKDGKHEAVAHLGQITALKIPNEKSQLRVVPNAENATAFLREWELLRQEMIRLGFANRSGQDWMDDARREAEKMQGKAKTDTPPQKAPVLTLHRKPNKQVKLLPRRLKDRLNCNANAADVVGVLFGGVGIRKMEITGAQCAGEFELHCATSLSINAPLDSDYVVFISLTMREIESIETGRSELLYLLWNREVAEIKIKQEQAGHCRMELFIDDNESQWEHKLGQQFLHLRGMTAATPNSFAGVPKDIPMEQDQDWYENKSHGLPLIDGCWRTLKTEWVNYESDTRTTTPKAKRGANDDTREKLKKLVQIRAQSKRNEKFTIAWTTACQQAGITPSTAKTHLPELNRRWDDANYNPNADDL